MKLLALVQDPKSIARYLAAAAEATEVKHRSPGRGPPYWKSRVLRRQVLGEADEGEGRGRGVDGTPLVLPTLTVDPETLAEIPIMETFSRGRSVYTR